MSTIINQIKEDNTWQQVLINQKDCPEFFNNLERCIKFNNRQDTTTEERLATNKCVDNLLLDFFDFKLTESGWRYLYFYFKKTKGDKILVLNPLDITRVNENTISIELMLTDLNTFFKESEGNSKSLNFKY